MKFINPLESNIKWIRSGKIGCTFASTLIRFREDIGWKFQISPKKLEWDKDTYILSIIFPGKNIHSVKEWALNNGMYIEEINDLYQGLRLRIDDNISWVQYFGPDSHVVTRQSPYPMLNLCIKVDKVAYFKVKTKGILHLAHASIRKLNRFSCDILWKSSFINTEKRLGHKPTIREAAKTTYEKKKL